MVVNTNSNSSPPLRGRGLLADNDKEQIIEERKEWYSRIFVKMEIVKLLKHRELCFLEDKSIPHEQRKKKARYCKAEAIDFLDKNFKWISFFDYLINMYHGVATLDYLPMMSFNMGIRTKEEKYVELNNNFLKHCICYDFFVDIDFKDDFKKGMEEAKQFKMILDEFELPYYIANSSSKGMHFIIMGEFLKIAFPDKKIETLIEEIRTIISNIKAIYEFECLDDSISDLKRVKKLPYSYTCDGFICLPLTDHQFNIFTPELVSMKNVLHAVPIKNRGLLIRNLTLNDSESKNIRRFWKEYLW